MESCLSIEHLSLLWGIKKALDPSSLKYYEVNWVLKMALVKVIIIISPSLMDHKGGSPPHTPTRCWHKRDEYSTTLVPRWHLKALVWE